MLLKAYACLCEHVIPLAAPRYLRTRLQKGKEMPGRVGERCAHPTRARPQGKLVWIHGASVGESLASLALIDKLLATREDLYVLSTSGTVSSARLLEKRLPERAFHQFLPLDVPSWTKRFLEYWKPDLALWMESELWPNTLAQAHAQNIPLLLLNARLSQKSQKRWRKLPQSFAQLLSCFEEVLTQTAEQEAFFRQAGARKTWATGNLKFASNPLPWDKTQESSLRARLAKRPFWVAASTHTGEEALLARAHQALKIKFPDLLTIIIPRHPERAPEIRALLEDHGCVAQRSQSEEIALSTDFYLVDTLGEMGLFFHLSDFVFLGGSLVPIGGHNLIEPAQLGCALIHGPHMFKQEELMYHFTRGEALTQVDDVKALILKGTFLLENAQERQRLAQRALRVAQGQRARMEETWQKILPFVEALS